MTSILPRERAEQMLADYAAGTPVRIIARTYGHSRMTVRDYVRGLRIPGEPAPRADEFEPFAAYCRHRLANDPHLRAPALLAEVARLGFPGARPTFYRALGRHEIQPHPCPDCHVARISGYAPLAEASQIQLPPLPLPASPVTGETLASFFSRLATVNRTSPEALLEALPPWFGVKARWHDDRWQHDQLTPWAGNATTQLAALSGSTARGLRSALPAFGASNGQPARAVTACSRCTAARRIQQPIPVHLPAHHQICLRHGTWLSPDGTPQFNISRCPDIIAAERQARRLQRSYSTEQLIYAKIRAAHGAETGLARAPERRMQVLIESNPRATAQSCTQEVLIAAAYPETITAAATAIRTSRKSPA